VATARQTASPFGGIGPDVRFLLTAREDLLALLAEVERLRAEVAALQGPGPPAAPPRQHHPLKRKTGYSVSGPASLPPSEPRNKRRVVGARK
jgi:hypothetical protein